jgi:hypothetical protein
MNKELIEALALTKYDPLKFVSLVFPWGEKDTILAKELPDKWQVEVLDLIGEQTAKSSDAVRIAIASGHTIGKTTLSAWILLWFLYTRPDCQIVITANTGIQLDTKTWREVAKWHKLMIPELRDMFTLNTERIYNNESPTTWSANRVLWNIHSPEAFSGTHEKYVLVIFDEASAIPDVIWDSMEGSINTPNSMWICFGNPTRNTGRFYESCFGKHRNRWVHKSIDSRDSKRADPKFLTQLIEDHGLDSDYVRVRILGKPPRQSTYQFISDETIRNCRMYVAAGYESFPKIMAVDVARFGEDMNVIILRQGRKIYPIIDKWQKLSIIESGDRVARAMIEHKPDYVIIDGSGVGGGLIDYLAKLGKSNIIEFNGGSKPDDKNRFTNARAETWYRMKTYLEASAELPKDNDLDNELTTIEYGYNDQERLVMESKEEMKNRGIASPDHADALAMTFYKREQLMSKPDEISSMFTVDQWLPEANTNYSDYPGVAT